MPRVQRMLCNTCTAGQFLACLMHTHVCRCRGDHVSKCRGVLAIQAPTLPTALLSSLLYFIILLSGLDTFCVGCRGALRCQDQAC